MRKKGHISKVCLSKTNQIIEEPLDSECDSVDDHNVINVVKTKNAKKKMVDTFINGIEIKMKLDRGSPCGIIGKKKIPSEFKTQWDPRNTTAIF